MQDCSDVMQLLLKTQTEMQDMPEDDPQVCCVYEKFLSVAPAVIVHKFCKRDFLLILIWLNVVLVFQYFAIFKYFEVLIMGVMSP